MKFKAVVECNTEEEVLPEGEFPFSLCSLLWTDMCEVATNVELQNPDAKIWSKCSVYNGMFYAKFIISGTNYGTKNAKIAVSEIGVLLAFTMGETLADVL